MTANHQQAERVPKPPAQGTPGPADPATHDRARPVARGTPGALQPVAPSLLVRIAARPMTKILNPLIRKVAGRRHFGVAAQIRHTGRRSGRAYITPAGAHLAGDVAVIPLTFGNQSDWSKNVRAAGGCSIRLNGQDYQATQPQFLGWQDAGRLVRAAFSPVQRAGFRLLGIKQFLCLQVVPAGQPGRSD